MLDVMDRTLATERLVEHLATAGLLKDADLSRARMASAEAGMPLFHALTSLGIVPEAELVAAISAVTGVPPVTPEEWPAELPGDASLRWLESAKVLPLRIETGRIVVATADPTDTAVLEALSLFFDCPVEPRVASLSELQRNIARFAQRVTITAQAAAGDDVKRLRDLASEAPVVRYVSRMIQDAVQRRATDIHLEAMGHGPALRLRVDGLLVDGEPPPGDSLAPVVSRLKILAGLDIAERRLPQDGRFDATASGRTVDIRVSTVPTLHGESVVLRVHDPSAVELDLEKLGFTPTIREAWLAAATRPNGILLVTAPTGHGKTTTLYSTLLTIENPTLKVFTIEDPIERQLPRINQTQVKPAIGLTFASTFRSLLRQNPDIVLVGELRDRETAVVATEASLTGHRVLSTLHTNDAASALARLGAMNIDTYVLASSLNGILAQRLIRTLCPHCAKPHPAGMSLLESLNLAHLSLGSGGLKAPGGCPQCGGSGWKGQTAIAEFLPISPEIRKAMVARLDAGHIAAVAREAGMVSMMEDGMRKALQGTTTPEEVLRVVAIEADDAAV
ncbi:GspE/PulE family protein [Indioceanicola profundi]|uniref:GspE/PulE family protein n=1 Tax=Indioceanicola profundi TaxID=2220096 RepID=UPI000E6A97B3|nr:GspE/PulE family protein [Indioceanicola profundi]